MGVEEVRLVCGVWLLRRRVSASDVGLLSTNGVYVSVKAGVSSGIVFLTSWLEKLDVAGKLGVRPVAAYLNRRVDRYAEW
jgi:hypothetical protein